MTQKPRWWEKMAFRIAGWVFNRPQLFAALGRLGKLGQKLHPLVEGTFFDPARAWTETRDTPQMAQTSFRDYMATRPEKS